MTEDGKLYMVKYRNDWKYAKLHKLIPDVELPNWMKPKIKENE